MGLETPILSIKQISRGIVALSPWPEFRVEVMYQGLELVGSSYSLSFIDNSDMLRLWLWDKQQPFLRLSKYVAQLSTKTVPNSNLQHGSFCRERACPGIVPSTSHCSVEFLLLLLLFCSNKSFQLIKNRFCFLLFLSKPAMTQYSLNLIYFVKL